MLALGYHSFVTFTLFLFFYSSISTDTVKVDDWDPGIQWHGAWTGLENQPAAWEQTLHWGNLSGSSVTFIFTGTSVKVFGAFKPVGTWDMESQYTIDDGEPNTFLPTSEVSQEAYGQTFFDSGVLTRGEHTLVVTNFGSQLWIDYFQVSNDTDTEIPSPSLHTSTSSTTSTSSAARIKISSLSSSSSSAGTPHTDATSIATSVSTEGTIDTSSTVSPAVSSFQLLSTASSTDPSLSGSLISTSSGTSQTATLISVSSWSSSTATSSSVSSATPEAHEAQSHLSGSSRKRIISLATSITVSGVTVIGMVLGIGCWYRRKRARHTSTAASYYVGESSLAVVGLLHLLMITILGVSDGMTQLTARTDADNTSAFGGENESFRSPSSATLLGPGLSRPPSSIADLLVSYSEYGRRPSVSAEWSHRRSVDAGVTIAGGLQGGEAPSIHEWQSMKSRLPPEYQAYHAM
ncbi:hypothetical protein DICSQDRAFT_129718 [Dichomitus squalens LYAD-421 SS1]|uniref:Uncharacterized protein n=1 Tax=Dichomitus squalens (strain LYAD-421) TaxID=732165 RepID=R7SLK2_DICSQ|nr:uncharacterized protein DICSQDRAFT_129718 [Dichomitus squalens LYAD-421 SS1]EJF57041.1 hypothetical protein DICSQDRAFT_129718 [Dichomitus squalens LYAD-421 SS1]